MGLFFVSGETPATVVDGRFWLGELCEGTVSETLKFIKRPETASQVSGQMDNLIPCISTINCQLSIINS